jgi:four helix bundle protein
MYIQSYKDLIVWRKSIELVKEVYKITQKFDKNEQYGLVSQMRRSAVSIPSNIAEGSRRNSLLEYIRFLNIANGSAAELETQIIISQELYLNLDFSSASSLLTEVLKMLHVMIKQLALKTKS